MINMKTAKALSLTIPHEMPPVPAGQRNRAEVRLGVRHTAQTASARPSSNRRVRARSIRYVSARFDADADARFHGSLDGEAA
jgi:hypothetical protein